MSSTTHHVNAWLRSAVKRLAEAGILNARLDAEVLLAHALGVNRSWLIAHNFDNIQDAHALEKANKLLAKRLDRVPVAYLTNHKEFYGRSFFVNESVLIPRPESETIVDTLRHIYEERRRSKVEGCQKILDVGCGSGCLGITAKLEIPELDVTLSDISPDALAVARKNAQRLGADVSFVHSDLLDEFGIWNLEFGEDSPSDHSNIKHRASSFDVIVANLPYVDRAWQTSPELMHEPEIALYAEEQGLKLIKTLLSQAPRILISGGYLLLEADPVQHKAIINYSKTYGFVVVEARDYVIALRLDK